MSSQWSFRFANRLRQFSRNSSPSLKASLAVGAGSLVLAHAEWSDDKRRILDTLATEDNHRIKVFDNQLFDSVTGLFFSGQSTAHCDSSSFSASVMTRLSNIRKRRNTFKAMRDQAERETLESRYDIDWSNPIGEGSFGSVYAADDRKTGEKVAIKKISKRATDDVSFQREMEALMHIRAHGGHPHICGLRANYDQGDYYYLVLDLVSGGEMFDHLCTHGAYSEADAARLIREVASALAFLHGLQTVHGDLKPENRKFAHAVRSSTKKNGSLTSLSIRSYAFE